MTMTREEFNNIKNQMLKNGWAHTESCSKKEAQENPMMGDDDWGLGLSRWSNDSTNGGYFWLNIDTVEDAPLDIAEFVDFEDDTIAKFRAKFPSFEREHSKKNMRKMLDGELLVVMIPGTRNYRLMTQTQIDSGLADRSLKIQKMRL
jgi:hypothetical protein